MTSDVVAFDAVVLAGGRARRLGGVDKASVQVGGRALVDHALAAVAGARAVVLVGPPSVARPGVPTVQEDPPFGGPVAGLAAGLAVLPSAPRTSGAPPALAITDATSVTADDLPVTRVARPRSAPAEGPVAAGDPLVVVLACDVPGAARVVPALLAAAHADPDADGSRLVAADGSPQHLVAAYRRPALDAALAALPDGPRDASVRRVVDGLRLVDVPDPDDAGADADTWDDVRRLDTRLGASGSIGPSDDDRRTP